jgi:hypothetical protein
LELTLKTKGISVYRAVFEPWHIIIILFASPTVCLFGFCLIFRKNYNNCYPLKGCSSPKKMLKICLNLARLDTSKFW